MKPEFDQRWTKVGGEVFDECQWSFEAVSSPETELSCMTHHGLENATGDVHIFAD